MISLERYRALLKKIENKGELKALLDTVEHERTNLHADCQRVALNDHYGPRQGGFAGSCMTLETNDIFNRWGVGDHKELENALREVDKLILDIRTKHDRA